MEAAEWKDKFSEKIEGITKSYIEVFEHMGTIDEIEGCSERELKELQVFTLFEAMDMVQKLEKIDIAKQVKIG